MAGGGSGWSCEAISSTSVICLSAVVSVIAEDVGVSERDVRRRGMVVWDLDVRGRVEVIAEPGIVAGKGEGEPGNLGVGLLVD